LIRGSCNDEEAAVVTGMRERKKKEENTRFGKTGFEPEKENGWLGGKISGKRKIISDSQLTDAVGRALIKL